MEGLQGRAVIKLATLERVGVGVDDKEAGGKAGSVAFEQQVMGYEAGGELG